MGWPCPPALGISHPSSSNAFECASCRPSKRCSTRAGVDPTLPQSNPPIQWNTLPEMRYSQPPVTVQPQIPVQPPVPFQPQIPPVTVQPQIHVQIPQPVHPQIPLVPPRVHAPIPQVPPALNLAPQPRQSLEVTWVPGYQAPTTIPVLPAMVPTATLESMEESLKKVFPDVVFEEEHIKERKRFLSMYDQQVQNCKQRCEEQLRTFAIKHEEFTQLEKWDRNLEALRAEKKTNRKRTPRTLKRLRTNPKLGTQSAGKKKPTKRRRDEEAQGSNDDDDDDGDHDQVIPLTAPLARMHINPPHQVDPNVPDLS